MKTKTTLVTLMLSMASAAICFAENQHMGTWKLNEAKSSVPAGMGKNTTVIYSAAERGMIKVTVEGVDKDGKPTHSVWIGKFDGKVYPAKGNLTYDQVMYKVVNEHTNDISAMKDGKLIWNGSITVAKDGKSRTVKVNMTDEKGKKIHFSSVYDKS